MLTLGATRASAFSEDHRRLVVSFAATASMAFQNAMLHREITKLATTDPLTGQLNRRAFMEAGQREIDRSQRFNHPLSAIMFDVDHFKGINDLYGHAVGDQVLCAVVERCSRVVRQIDILGRLGGDEFAILLPEADRFSAQEIAERIRRSVDEVPVPTLAGPVDVSISVGVAQARKDTASLSDLFFSTDKALYLSKQAGRNRIEVSLFA